MTWGMSGVSAVVTMSEAAAEGLSRIGIGDFQTVEQPDRMAFVCLVLRGLEDLETWFPKGKWATIQSLSHQVEDAARLVSSKVGS